MDRTRGIEDDGRLEALTLEAVWVIGARPRKEAEGVPFKRL